MLEILKLQLVLKEKHTPQQLENRASKILKRFYNRFSQSHHLFIRPDTKRNLFTQIFPPLRHFYLFRLFPFDIFLLLIGHYLVLVLQQPIEKKFSDIFLPKFNWFIGKISGSTTGSGDSFIELSNQQQKTRMKVKTPGKQVKTQWSVQVIYLLIIALKFPQVVSVIRLKLPQRF